MKCAECGHALVNHGDRAIVACDGGMESRAAEARLNGKSRGPTMSLCYCTGWKAPEDAATQAA